MRWPLFISLFLILIGLGLVAYAATLPVYTEKDAPERLSDELESKPRANRFREWYARLPSYETAHKKLSDFGRGLMAAGAGLLLASVFWFQYRRSRRMRTILVVLPIWIALWAVRIPLTFWYYQLREDRFDYPVWGDSTGIPIISECMTWIVGAIVSSTILLLLLVRHPLPATITLVKPCSVYGWIRAILIICWIFVLGAGLACAIPDGDEGTVLTSILASIILMPFLAAPEVKAAQRRS